MYSRRFIYTEYYNVSYSRPKLKNNNEIYDLQSKVQAM